MSPQREPSFAEEIAGLWDASEPGEEPLQIVAVCAQHGRRLALALREDGEATHRCPVEGCVVEVFIHIKEMEAEEEGPTDGEE